jgi:hypothetical protein
MGAKHLVHVEISTPEGLTLSKLLVWRKRKLGGETAVARASPNVAYGFIDRCLSYFWHASRWCHGRREKAVSSPALPDNVLAIVRTSQWSDAERKCVQNFCQAVMKSPEDDSLREIGEVKDLISTKLTIIAPR